MAFKFKHLKRWRESCLTASLAQAAPVLVNGGFETEDLSGWTTAAGTPVVTTADITEFSFWVEHAGGPFDFLQLFYGDGSNENVFSSGTSSDWTFFDFTASLDVGKTVTGFLIYGTSPGPAYLDDFVISTRDSSVPEPSNMALVGLALLGLYASRRQA